MKSNDRDSKLIGDIESLLQQQPQSDEDKLEPKLSFDNGYITGLPVLS